MITSRAGAMSLNPVVPKEANLKIDWFHCIYIQKSSSSIAPFSKIEWFHGTTWTTTNTGPGINPGQFDLSGRCMIGEREPFNGLTLSSCHQDVVALEIDGDSMTVLHRCWLRPRRPSSEHSSNLELAKPGEELEPALVFHSFPPSCLDGDEPMTIKKYWWV